MMKKLIVIISVIVILAVCIGAGFMMVMADGEQEGFTLEMQINNPQMSVNGEQTSIDDSGTTPVGDSITYGYPR